jgi:hypothetical protein
MTIVAQIASGGTHEAPQPGVEPVGGDGDLRVANPVRSSRNRDHGPLPADSTLDDPQRPFDRLYGQHFTG